MPPLQGSVRAAPADYCPQGSHSCDPGFGACRGQGGMNAAPTGVGAWRGQGGMNAAPTGFGA
ncbi:MAG: hypothetical protein K0S95_69 [Pantoea eucrina]|jgi:hypothetical protein|nr:hypothetical protein [Pantoea eucrina]